jgi:hypothetical protein
MSSPIKPPSTPPAIVPNGPATLPAVAPIAAQAATVLATSFSQFPVPLGLDEFPQPHDSLDMFVSVQKKNTLGITQSRTVHVELPGDRRHQAPEISCYGRAEPRRQFGLFICNQLQ